VAKRKGLLELIEKPFFDNLKLRAPLKIHFDRVVNLFLFGLRHRKQPAYFSTPLSSFLAKKKNLSRSLQKQLLEIPLSFA